MADASKVSAELRKINQDSKETQAALREVNKNLKLDPNNAEVIAQKLKLIEEEATRLKRKYDLLNQAQQEMKQYNTQAFNAEKLKNYDSSLNRINSSLISTKAQLNSLDLQRQQEADKAAAKEREAAAEAVALANARYEAEQRVARERQKAEEQRRKEEQQTHMLYLSMVEAERQADERRQAERLAQEQAVRQKIKDLGSQGMKQIAQGVTQLNTALTQAIRTATMLEVAMLRVGTSAVKTGMEFDESMSQVAATLDIEQTVHQSESAFARLRNEAIQLGAVTTYTASQVSEALNQLALGGLGVEQSLQTLPQVLTLSKAGSMELEEASTIVVASMKALNLSTSEVDTLLDQMAKTAQKSKVTVEETGQAILKTASAFNLAGQDLSTMNAIIGTLGNRFENIADQANTLRTALNRISTYADDLAELGISVEDSSGHVRDFIDIFSELRVALEDKTDTERVSILTKIFGNRGYSYAAYLMEATTGELQNLRAEIENSTGAAQKMADTMTDNLASDITIVKSAAETLAISMTDQLTPAFREAAKNAVTSINQITDEVKNGELGKELKKTSTALSQLLGSALEQLIKHGPQIIKFFNFIVENAGKLLKLMIALKGIKWASTAVSGLTKIVTGLGKLHSALTLATTASTGLVSSFAAIGSGLTNPIVLLTAALATLTAGIIKAKTAAIDVTEGIYPTDEMLEYEAAVEKTVQTLAEARTEREGEIDDIEKQRQEYKKMAERVEELAATENRTAAQEREMNSLIAELNTAIPDLGLNYDSLTNSLNMQNGEMETLIDNYLNYQKVIAMTDYASELAKQKVKLEVEYDDAQTIREQKKAAVEEAENKLRKELEKGRLQGAYTDEEWASVNKPEVINLRKMAHADNYDEIVAAYDAYKNAKNDLAAASTKAVELSGAIKGVTQKQDKLNKEIDEFSKKTDEAALSAEEYKKILEEQLKLAEEYIEAGEDDALAKQLEQYPELIEKLEALGYDLSNVLDKTEDTSTAYDKLASKSKTLQEATAKYKTELKDLLGVLENVNKGTAYSTSQILDLIDKYPQLASAISATADGYTIEAEAVKALTQAKADEMVASAKAQLVTLEAQQAIIDSQLSDSLVSNVVRQGMDAMTNKLQQQIDMYRRIANDISAGNIYSGSSSSSSSSASSSAEDDWVKERKEAAKAEEAELENQYKTEKISAEEYYNGLMDIARRYYAGISELREEYLSAENKVYEGLKKAQEDELSTAKKLEDQLRAVKEAEDALRNAQQQQVQVFSSAAGFHAEQDTAAIAKAQQTLADKNYNLTETLLKNAKFDGKSLTERLQNIGLYQIRDMLPDLSGLTLPSLGSGSTTNNSTRNVTYNGGDISINIQGNVDPETMPTLKTSIEDAVRKGIEQFLDEENALAQTGGI